jgi:GTPase Era involved in 16S rRNA processing
MHYKAKIYNNTETIINDIKANIKIFKFNNIILCFDGNSNIQSHLDYWNNLVNKIRTKHVDINNLPHIIFLNPFGDNIDLNNQFLNYEDKRTITILNVLRNTSENSIETNYRLIFSLLWEKNLHFNQMKIKSSKNFNADLFRFNMEPANSIKILLTGFSRCGKSTFINLIFNKLISRESPNPLPVTKNSVEYFYCMDQPDKDKDNGLILIDSPGVLGTSDNQNLIKEIINNAIANCNETLDNINYILFFYSATQTFQYTEQFLLFLNGLSIPVLFVITHSPIEDHSHKESLLNYLNLKKFNNLIVGEEGNNIFEVDLKNKDEGRINKVFKYMYNDLIKKNAFLTNNKMIEDKAKKEEIEKFIRDLNKKSNLFNKIKGINDIVTRGRKKANIAIASFISTITVTGFSPIPLVDIPLFFIFLATMLICIISSYQIKLKSVNYSEFFSFIFENNKAGDLLSESHNDLKNLKTEEKKKVSSINKMILRLSGGTVALFATL